ncbi:DUF3307 domain-containing protein [Leclercia adecarboxylata]|uniref:DUF3307 domain-containing protein n=1 Tax=Enterobacteriaceae TaxID=543 RepID=UPI001D0C785F|nr:MULTISPECIES: DUF3307 domain-containing protein [Enterobacteriaceae]MDQ2131564.1 DUF3307 domain-containing protein [Leclercia adecarboxylata]MDV7060181.1 DUF3307 domain-containing protein [Leclercia adecarboxylata]
MILLFLLLFLVHILFDFYIQNEKMVVSKSFNRGVGKALKYHFIHAGSHGFFSSFICFVFIFSFLECVEISIFRVIVSVFVFFTVSHFIVDVAKSLISLKIVGFYAFIAFLIDQVIHVSLLFYGVSLFFSKYNSYMYEINLINHLSIALLFVCAVLALLKPSSIIVYSFFKSSGINDGSGNVKITKSQVSDVLYSIFCKDFIDGNVTDYQATALAYRAKADKVVLSVSNGNADIDIKSILKVNNAGRVIGYVERLIIFLFLILGSVTAVVAVLAMKTALRFSDLKDDNDSGKAEYIMIGTFFSLLVTVLISIITRVCLVELGVKINDFS